MILRINHVPVDFRLEHETTVSEFYQSIQTWADDQKQVVLSFLADGKAASETDGVPLESIQTIDIEMVAQQEQTLAHVQIVTNYFQLLYQAVQNSHESLLRELQSEWKAIQASLYPIFLPLKRSFEPLCALLDQAWEFRPELHQALDQLIPPLSAFANEVAQPRTSFQETLNALNQHVEQLESLSTLLHQGHDAQAMQQVLELLGTLERLNRQAPFWQNSVSELTFSWKDFSQELQPFLIEVEQALMSRDFVLMTDLLEYEIGPRLQDLISHLGQSPSLSS